MTGSLIMFALVAQLPDGVVTFLFSDIEGSTALWDTDATAMRTALAAHDALTVEIVGQSGGVIFKHTGDGFAAAFSSPAAALEAAVAIAARLPSLDGPTLLARMGIHTGEAISRDGDYFGPEVNKAARIMDSGNGGQIVMSSVVHALVGDASPSGSTTVDLGEHRLKDLGEPAHLFLVRGVSDSEMRPLRTLDAAPNNLPLQLSSFIGRQDEIAQVACLVRETRLTTLTGIGGVGKTRLSLQVGAELLHEFTDGVWLLELAGLSEPGLIPQTAISAIRLKADPARPPMSQLLDELAPKDLLIIIDNCEHLIDDVAKFVDQVLRAAPRVRALATSREGLAIGGERLWRVPSLTVDDDSGAIALFEERARLVRHEFEITDENREAVAALCKRLDGIPLAIELATARLKMLDVRQIAEHLGDRFRLLTGGARTSVERQRTLLAMMDWSYELLNEHEQALLRRLAVFVGGFTFEAAEVVTSGETLPTFEILDLLSRLVETSLVTFEQGPDPRYRLLETVRQYASDKLLDAGESDEARHRHAEYYGHAAITAERKRLESGGDEYSTMMERDLPNMRAAMTWAYDAGEVRAGLKIAAGLRTHLYNISAMDEAWRWASRGLELANDLEEDFEIQVLAYGLTDAGNTGDFEAVARLATQAELFVHEIDNPELVGALRNALGNTRIGNDVRAAMEQYELAIAAYKEAGSNRWADTMVNLLLLLIITGSRKIAARLEELVSEADASQLTAVVDAGATRAVIALVEDRPNDARDELASIDMDLITETARGFVNITKIDVYRILGDVDTATAALAQAAQVWERAPGVGYFLARAETLLLLDTGAFDDVVRALRPLKANLATTFGLVASRALVAAVHGQLAGGRNDQPRAVRLIGYWDRMRSDDHLGMLPADQRKLDAILDEARTELGVDVVDRLLAEGAATEFDDLPLYES